MPEGCGTFVAMVELAKQSLFAGSRFPAGFVRLCCRQPLVAALPIIFVLLFYAPDRCLALAGSGPTVMAVVKASAVNVRSAPQKNSKRLFGLHTNDEVEVVEERDLWVQIRTDAGKTGWVFRPLVAVVRPEKKLPEITLELNNVPPGAGHFFTELLPSLQRDLQTYDPQKLTLVVSYRGEADAARWMIVLEIPFSHERYQRLKGQDVGDGTIDLLPYVRYLSGLLRYRLAIMTSWAEQQSSALAAMGIAEDEPVSCYLTLVKKNGDRLFLTGEQQGPFALFSSYLIAKLHGYAPFQVGSLLPGCVRDFNKFILPESLDFDGRRTTVAAVYDFFGFPY